MRLTVHAPGVNEASSSEPLSTVFASESLAARLDGSRSARERRGTDRTGAYSGDRLAGVGDS